MSITLIVLLILAVIAVLFLVNSGSRGTSLRGGGTTRVVEREVAEPRPAETERVVERRVVEREVEDPNQL